MPPGSVTDEDFLAARFDRGLAWVHFPEGCGGLGLSPRLHPRVVARLQAGGAPGVAPQNLIGHGMVAPTVVVHGTDAQRRRYLRPLFTSEEVWCQLFSEPGAGSDVASLATRAERDGDEWVLNGQKVWTTVAHLSGFGLLLARTDPDLPKHAGHDRLSGGPAGARRRGAPLYQITGEAEFNEVSSPTCGSPTARASAG